MTPLDITEQELFESFKSLERVLPELPEMSQDIFKPLDLQEDNRNESFVSGFDDMLEYFGRLNFALSKRNINQREQGSFDNTVGRPETKSDSQMNQNASIALRAQEVYLNQTNKKKRKRPYNKKSKWSYNKKSKWPCNKNSNRSCNKKHPSSTEVRKKDGTSGIDEVRDHVHVYTQEEKRLRVIRFKQKKNRPKKTKNTTYCGRKHFANIRPREGGRFVQMKNKRNRKESPTIREKTTRKDI
jgi:hypothetical protein